MTENTTRVRDLSTELGVSNKELIQALREMGIHVKSHLAGVEEEDADQLRALFKERAQSTEVVTKEIQPGMIVRRRRTRTPKKAKKEAEPETEAEAVAEEEVPEEPVAAETPPEAAEVPPESEEETFQDAVVVKTPAQVEAEAKAAAEAEEAAEVEAEARDAETAAQAAEAAPDADAETAEPVQAEAETAEDATAGAEAGEQDTPQEEAAAPKAKGKKAKDEEAEGEDAEPAKKAKKKRKKKKEAAAGPQVTIISRPDPSEKPAPKPPAPSRPKAPGGGRRPDKTPRRPDAPPHPTADAPGRKKRRKDRRVVEFPQHLSEEENRRRTSLQMKKKRGDQHAGGPGRGKRRRNDFDAANMTFTTQAEQAAQPLKAAKRKLKIDEAIRVSDMAHQMGVKAQALIKVLLGLGVMTTINQSLDMDTASLVAAEFGYETEKVGFSEDDYIVPREEDDPKTLRPRPPVVTIMGHVDHGKTSLLDAIRESKVTSGEAGGITQHIGAYHVKTSRGELVFLDTPGHEAFTAMRARGAQVTDVVVLVVAADDGVMDQTREAINHSKAAGVPIIVAVNKMDKEGADPDRVKRELAELGLLPEDWGGETIYAHVSAKQRTGIDELLEFILLQAEILELKANPDKFARGNVVEAKLDKGRGAVATVLVREGTLNLGDNFVCGLYNGRVRAMFNDHGKKTKQAGPAIPVEVQGIEGVPEAGDEFMVVQDEKVARRIASARQLKQRERELAKTSKVTLESFLEQKAAGEAQVLPLILKTDVQGSLEAVIDALRKLSTDEVKVDIIHGGTGAITETDILLASASNGIVIGFNVRPTVKVKEVAEQESVDIRFYDIIYKLVSDVKDAMSGMLSPEIREVYLGQAEVRQTFGVPKVGTIAGCAVVDGKITRNAGVRLLRDGVVVYTGTISSLKRFKDDAKEVAKGYECGIGLENYNDLKAGDFIEAFEEVEEARTLD